MNISNKPLLFIFLASLNLSAQPDYKGYYWNKLTDFEGRDVMFLYENGEYMYAGIGGQGLVYTQDYGRIWQSVDLGHHAVTPTSIIAENGLYVLSTLDHGVFNSVDGKIFKLLGDSLTYMDIWKAAFYRDKIFVSTNQGILSLNVDSKSNIWAQEDLPIAYSGEVLFEITSNSEFLIAGGREKVYIKRSNNPWELINFDFQFDIRNIVIFSDNSIWVGTNGAGAFVSVDHGYTWMLIDKDDLQGNVLFLSKSGIAGPIRLGSGGLMVNDTKLGEEPGLISFKNAIRHKEMFFAGTVSDGIWIFEEAEFEMRSTVPEPDISTDEYAIFPNPTTGSFSMMLKSGMVYQNALLSIYDNAGRRIHSTELIPNSISEIHLDAPTGLYHYSITRGNHTIGQGKIIVQH